MRNPQSDADADDKRRNGVSGDPGVGGLLSDPLQPSGPHHEPDPNAGPPSPDPEPPRHHGDWAPVRKNVPRVQSGARWAAIMRRKSQTGMPRALFREDDDTSLDDLKALALAYSHQYALRPPLAGRATTRRNAI